MIDYHGLDIDKCYISGCQCGKPKADDLRTRIAAVQREHRLTSFGANYVQCECGWKSPEKYATWTDHPEHVADVVIRELQLHEENGWFGPTNIPKHRYVTEWSNDE